jgi:hypothetical protein
VYNFGTASSLVEGIDIAGKKDSRKFCQIDGKRVQLRITLFL